MKTILIASDHAGVEYKRRLQESFSDWSWKDLGPFDTASVDYPDYADHVAHYINDHPDEMAILICGSGQGMAIRANKYPNVRAALCYNETVSCLSRAHNNANILCLGSRAVDFETAEKIVTAFFNTPFEGGRHAPRVEKLSLPLK